jgi:hypothetical protein
VVVTAVIMFVCVIAGLNIWSTVEILRDDGSSRVQKMAQISFVWLVPILGALLALYLVRQNVMPSAGTYPKRPVHIEDIAFTSGPGLTYPENTNGDIHHE